MTTAVVIGGGVGGSSAALRMADAGFDVVLTERSDHLGGLVVSLDIAGTPIERFYHHIFPHEHEIISLIGEMGLSPRLEWIQSSVGMLLGGKIWPFVSPVDLLRFGPIGLVDRVHTGIGGLRSMRWKDWESLDAITAQEWLANLTGRRGYEAVWEPLLRGKFGSAAGQVPAAWMWGRFQQRAAARKTGIEKLG